MQQLAQDFHAQTSDHGGPDSERIQELYSRVKGLHALLPRTPTYSYSILVPVQQPQAKLFGETVRSAARQTASQAEILVGFDGESDPGLEETLHQVRKEFPAVASSIRSFRFDRTQTLGKRANLTNLLAERAAKVRQQLAEVPGKPQVVPVFFLDRSTRSG